MYLEQLNMIVFISEMVESLKSTTMTDEEKALKHYTVIFMLTKLAKSITDEAARVTAYQQTLG